MCSAAHKWPKSTHFEADTGGNEVNAPFQTVPKVTGTIVAESRFACPQREEERDASDYLRGLKVHFLCSTMTGPHLLIAQSLHKSK